MDLALRLRLQRLPGLHGPCGPSCKEVNARPSVGDTSEAALKFVDFMDVVPHGAPNRSAAAELKRTQVEHANFEVCS